MVPLLWFLLPKTDKRNTTRNGENNVNEKHSHTSFLKED